MNSQDNKQPNKRHSSEERIEDSASPVKEKTEPDKYDITETANAISEQDIADRILDRELKGKYANKLFWFLIIYTLAVMVIVVAQGVNKFSIHDIPLSLLISSIVIMTIGVGRFVVKSLTQRK